MKVDLRRRSTGRPSAYRPGAVDDAAVVPQVALAIEHGHVQPAVIGPRPRGPDNRTDFAALQIEAERRRGRQLGGREALRRADLGIACVIARPLVERVQHPLHLQVRQRELIAQAAREQRAAVAHGRQPADQLHAGGAQRIQIERDALGRADQLRRRQPARALQIVDLVVALVPQARVLHPPQHVAAAVGARHAHVLARPRA